MANGRAQTLRFWWARTIALGVACGAALAMATPPAQALTYQQLKDWTFEPVAPAALKGEKPLGIVPEPFLVAITRLDIKSRLAIIAVQFQPSGRRASYEVDLDCLAAQLAEAALGKNSAIDKVAAWIEELFAHGLRLEITEIDGLLSVAFSRQLRTAAGEVTQHLGQLVVALESDCLRLVTRSNPAFVSPTLPGGLRPPTATIPVGGIDAVARPGYASPTLAALHFAAPGTGHYTDTLGALAAMLGQGAQCKAISPSYYSPAGHTWWCE